MRRVALVLLALLGVLLVVLAVRAGTLPSRQPRVEPAALPSIDAEAVAARLGASLRFRTISHLEAEKFDGAPFLALHAWLARTYPEAHRVLRRDLVSDYTLLYTWPGRDPSLKPVVLLAHQDVVPVDPGTEDRWLHPPYSGAIADGYVWGRGALDDKVNVVMQLEAVERLLARGFRPRRTVMLAFGHDEELGGPRGAGGVAALLAERGVEPEIVLDEGGSVIRGMFPGVDEPLAVVGIAEKGYLSTELVVESAGGHSSTPPSENAIAVLAEAVLRLENDPFPSRLVPATRAFFDALAPEAPFGMRLALANLWLFEPVLLAVLGAGPTTGAIVRTTTATTLIGAGVKDNVVPARASAVVNHRILPGDTIETTLARDRAVVADPRVAVGHLPKRRDPSPMSDIEAPAFDLLARTIREVFPQAIVAPYLMVGGTDARHFRPLTPRVYRFMPFPLVAEDLSGIHGTNERVRVDALPAAVGFYVRFLRNAAG